MNSPTMKTGEKPMQTLGSKLRRNVVVAVICLSTMTNSGCLLTGGFINVIWTGMMFWKTLPPVPVSAYKSQLLEDKLWTQERYDRTPVLDPVEGDVFCVDPPSEDQVMRGKRRNRWRRTPWGANVRDCRITPFSDIDLPSIAGGRTRRSGDIH